MTSAFTLPENLKMVQMVAPAVGAGAVVTSTYISLKNAHKCWIVIHYADGNGNAVSYQPMKATAVAPSDATAITNVVKIWSNMATGTNDRLVERTAATVYAQTNAVTNKMIVFEIDPADLGELAGTGPYDCIGFTATTPAAGEYIEAIAYLQPRYASQVSIAPTALTD